MGDDMAKLLYHFLASGIISFGIFMAAEQINSSIGLDEDEFLPVNYKKVRIPFFFSKRGGVVRFSAYWHLRLAQILLLFEIIFIIVGRCIVGDFSFLFNDFMTGYLNFEVACLFIPRFIIWCYVKIRKSFQNNHYKFLHDKSQMNTIEIARYEDGDFQKNDPLLSIIKKIEDNNAFLKKFRKISGYKAPCPGKSSGITEGSYIIKISYHNGDYELVGVLSQLKYIHQYDFYDKDADSMIFSEKEFLDMIYDDLK